MLTDRDIHRLGLPVRCAALGLPDTSDGLRLLHDWGECAWTARSDFRLAAIDRSLARAARSAFLLGAAAHGIRVLGYPDTP